MVACEAHNLEVAGSSPAPATSHKTHNMKHKNTKTQILLTSLVLFITCGGIASAATLDSEEQAFVDLLNDYRKSLGRTELKVTKSLLNGAEYFAQNLSENPNDSNVCIHIDSLGVAPEERGQKYGYYFLTENIGWGYETGQQIFDAWKDSEGHHDNMVDSEGRTIGIARYYNPSALGGIDCNGEAIGSPWFWAMDISDEGTARLIGHNLKNSELYHSTGYKKISLTVKKKSKTGKYKAAKQALVRVYDSGTGQLIDKDVVDRKGKATLFTYQNPGNVVLRVYKSIVSKKPKKTKRFSWNKNQKYTIKYDN